ncbi:hypothetical protein P152DRAFT_399440 [Eremomyces bilateralis CBS 781.70]|uniref:Stress-response A/B barrel domain-containing protein n=1 Tax=Eremomyces bilateralis CBS 781.70 TaxID=1392243 RepID=A0A6G1G041_9PEZI|nr:uncharacterized protein P152DRAFT_399440 [Eremomyces bilateralis CBS 781.70]KAF1811403.1 hypothetical protein P152DRAFT_399440 [Eremomyces bilateralis CBS 781.70]
MGVTHIVLFQFKSTASAEAITDVSRGFLALKDGCVHPTSQKPYIKSVSGGIENSTEGLQNGITHAFVVEFESVKDRDYYVSNDPAHGKFKETLGQVLEKAQVIDFTDGTFT